MRQSAREQQAVCARACCQPLTTCLPCAQQKQSCVAASCHSSCSQRPWQSGVPNMMAPRQALLRSTRKTPDGSWPAQPPVSCSWCRYS